MSRRFLFATGLGMLTACTLLGVAFGIMDHGSKLRVDLFVRQVGPDGFPAAFRVVLTNTSRHELPGGSLRLSIWVGQEFLTWATSENPAEREFHLGPGQSVERVLEPQSMMYPVEHGGSIDPARVIKTLRRSSWNVVARAIDESGDNPEGDDLVWVWSNELHFRPTSSPH